MLGASGMLCLSSPVASTCVGGKSSDDSIVVFTLARSLNVSSSVTKHTKIKHFRYGIFFFSKNAVQYIIYSLGVKIQHQYISAGNTKWVYTKCMLFKWL